MSRKKDIVNLKDQRKEIDKSIDELQSACDHKSTSIKSVQQNQSYQYMWACNDCEKALSYPTPKEIEDYVKS
tara:strand:+ start:50157 stop:50372 length:216 start_codon:yes stop_codon:yes gene_type:complete